MKNLAIIAFLVAAACGDADDPAPPEPTPEEQARALNEAHASECHLCAPVSSCVPCYWQVMEDGETVMCLVVPVGTDREALCSF